MPVLLTPDDYQTWQDGPPDRARALCMAWPGALKMDRTDDPWTHR